MATAFRKPGKPGRPQAGFLADTRGATAVEFSLVAIPFLALLLVSLQTFMVFFFEQAIQTLTISAGRQLMVGNAQSQNLSQGQFKTLVCNQAPAIFKCQNIMVDVRTATSFSALDTSSIKINYDNAGNPTNTFSYQTGGASSAVIIRVMYDWPVIGGPLGVGLANQGNGSHLMIGTAVFKTEPYS